MNNKIQLFLLAFWGIFVVVMILLYFFYPSIFYHIWQYPGAGSPYVNTPRG